MKINAWVPSAAGVLLITGCVVTSVSPFYSDRDLVFEPAILGDWRADDSQTNGEIWRFDRSGELSYRFTTIKADGATVMIAHAFKLDGQLFLDVTTIGEDIHNIPPHFLLKINEIGTSLRLAQLDNDWMKDALAKKPGLIPHELLKGENPADTRVVLTADTPGLQKFVRQNLKTTNAWADIELQRENR